MYNFYAEQLFLSVMSQIDRARNGDSRLQFIIGDIRPEDAVLLMDKCSNLCQTRNINFQFKLAEKYSQIWDAAYREKFAANFAEGNLTQYRNDISPNTLQILVGTNHVTDKGSLGDFYKCDGEALWAESMHGSFEKWIERFFDERGFSTISDEDVRKLEAILCYLNETSGLSMVSRLLVSVPTNLDFATVAELLADLLTRLKSFNLPNLSGFALRKTKSKSFRYYAETATAFFSYDLYLEESRRKKALTSIDLFRRKDPMPELSFMPYASKEDLVDATEAYVRTGSAEREGLMSADFTEILDKILDARPDGQNPRSRKDTLKKLSGSPVEAVLVAVWRTLGEYVSSPDHRSPREIDIRGIHYRYDQVMDGTNEQIKAELLKYLKRLLGGVDSMCEKGITLKQDSGEEIAVHSCLLRDEITITSAKTAEPYFEFHVTVTGEEDAKTVLRFAIRLPDTHPNRLAIQLFEQADHFLDAADGVCKLPVFHFEYYRELMLARDADEIRRVLAHCLTACREPRNFGSILVTSRWWREPQMGPLRGRLGRLATSYRDFVRHVCDEGLYSALAINMETPELFNAYLAAAAGYTNDDANNGVTAAAESRAVAAMLMRAFLVVEKRSAEDIDEWGAADFEPSAIVTALHPAMLEMLRARMQFLFESFSRAADKELRGGDVKTFREARWQYYVDLAELKMPIVGLAVDGNNKRFEVCSGGDGLVHRVGSITAEQKLAATRFLTRYDRVDDDEISLSEMFRESSESKHLLRIIRDYVTMHPGARDGLTLAVYRNEDVQPVLAAIDGFAKWLATEEHGLSDADRPERYALRVVFFSESSDTSVVANWLGQWQEFLDDAEEEDPGYASMRFSVSHRIVRRDDGYAQFANVIKNEIDADIFVFYSFIKPDSQGCEFQRVDEFDVTRFEIKFPILEQAQCAKTAPNELYHRSQIVSNRQFRIATSHAEVIARLRDRNCGQNAHHIVLATGDYKPWRDVIDSAHAVSEWVVCIDALIDKALLAECGESSNKRELIGFGSGVGLHGEKNYTISTQKHSVATINKQLIASMGQVYRYGTEDQFKVIADTLIGESSELAGLSLIRSLGPEEYVRDFMAYSLMHRILPLDMNSHLCDRIFSIDAYHHWFDQAGEEDKTHPDLLWLRVDIDDDGKLNIQAKLIECKMAGRNEEHLEKAMNQIANGLKVLSEVFRPHDAEPFAPNFGFGLQNRPDQRYWHLQLHRMIASSVQLSGGSDMPRYLAAMENLAAGDFKIEWGAGIFAFWTDSDSSEMWRVDSRPLEPGFDGAKYTVPVYECGCNFVYQLCKDDSSPTLEWGAQDLQTARCPADAMPERELSEVDDDADNDDPDAATEPPQPVSVPDAPLSASSPVTDMRNGVSVAPSPQSSALTTASIPDRVLLGKTADGKEVCWEFGHPKLNNRHFLIFGNSGMGKTYAIQAILCELGCKGQNSLIVDYTNGFLPNQLQETTNRTLRPNQNVVKQNKLPLNPFKKHSQDIGIGMPIEDSDGDVAKRVTSIFDSVYQMGDQQTSVLIDAIKNGLESYGEQMSLERILPILTGFLNDNIHPKNSVQSLMNKLKPFIDEAPFRSESMIGWLDLFTNSEERCQVFQMVMIDKLTARILTEFILWDLWAFTSSGGSEKNPRIVVLDEVQNLDQRLESPLGKYLTEGRKFGLCVMAATQTLSNLKRDEQARLFQSGHKLFFRPADPEINQYTDFVAQASGNGDKNHWRSVLTSLNKGECLSIGPELNPQTGNLRNAVHRIKITALEDRGF